jgi:hypothetical protein
MRKTQLLTSGNESTHAAADLSRPLAMDSLADHEPFMHY